MSDTQKDKEIVGYWQEETPTKPGFYLIEVNSKDEKFYNVLHIYDGLMTVNGKSIKVVEKLAAKDGNYMRFADIGAAKG